MKKKKYKKPAMNLKKMSQFFFNCKAGASCSTRINKDLSGGSIAAPCKC